MPLPKPPHWPLTDRRRQFVPGLVVGTLWVVGGAFFVAGDVTEPWLPAGAHPEARPEPAGARAVERVRREDPV